MQFSNGKNFRISVCFPWFAYRASFEAAYGAINLNLEKFWKFEKPCFAREQFGETWSENEKVDIINFFIIYSFCYNLVELPEVEHYNTPKISSLALYCNIIDQNNEKCVKFFVVQNFEVPLPPHHNQLGNKSRTKYFIKFW